MPAGDMPQRERRAAMTFLVEHASQFDVCRIYGSAAQRKGPLKKRAIKKSTDRVEPQTEAVGTLRKRGRPSKLVAVRSSSSQVNTTSTKTESKALPNRPRAALSAKDAQTNAFVYPVTISGEKLRVPFLPSMTVQRFMEAVEHLHGVPVARQRYFIGTREITSLRNKSLRDVGLFDGCVFLLANQIGATVAA